MLTISYLMGPLVCNAYHTVTFTDDSVVLIFSILRTIGARGAARNNRTRQRSGGVRPFEIYIEHEHFEHPLFKDGAY